MRIKTTSVSNAQRREIRKLIREEFTRRQLISEHANYVHEKMLIYESKSLQRGLNQESINAGLVKIINEDINFGDVGFDMIKRYLAGLVLNFLGIDQSKDPMLFTFLQNVIEAIDFSELSKYFGTGKCEAITNLVTEAATEAVLEIGGEKIIAYVAAKALPENIASAITDSLDSAIVDAGQEAVNEVVVAIVKGYIVPVVQKYVCEGSLTDLIGSFSSSGGSGGGILDSIMSGFSSLSSAFGGQN